MILTIRGHLFKCWRDLWKHALDTIGFPGSRGSFRSETRMASKPLRRLQCRSITWTAPLPIPFSSIYGFTITRHNEWFNGTEICSDVCVEPELQPVSGEELSSNVQDGARLDIACNGFWGGRFERTYLDVQVHTQDRSNTPTVTKSMN